VRVCGLGGLNVWDANDGRSVDMSMWSREILLAVSRRFVEFVIHVLGTVICLLSMCPWQWVRHWRDVLGYDVALEW